ncbi:MAG: hypothetical protein JSV98_02680 [candidate division WOR-3 bacterium]|nr:MAG: hypothetical protein JSV98_02680 [candidate division WOR-3 bacterium]
MSNKSNIVFTTVAYPIEWSEANALLLIESIRSFGGGLSRSPIWCFVPDFGPKPSKAFKEKMAVLNAELISFEIERDIARFFFAADIRAAALAESMAVSRTDILVWLSSNTIILKEPGDFLLADDRDLGYRPVHHTNIGSIYDEPIDAFWSSVYEHCEVPEDRIFPMKTHVDNNITRPYFNAGMLVLRPQRGLFSAWRDKFFRVYRAPEYAELYENDERYAIFIHQALLSGIILSNFGPDEIQELPPNYNYPLHLYKEDVTSHRPLSIDELIIVRHEGFNRIPEWIDKIPGGEQFKHWFADRRKSNQRK